MEPALERDIRVSRATATRYLDALADYGILEKHKLGRENYYLNPLRNISSSNKTTSLDCDREASHNLNR